MERRFERESSTLKNNTTENRNTRNPSPLRRISLFKCLWVLRFQEQKAEKLDTFILENAKFTGMDLNKMENGFRMILEGMGEDPSREGLLDTPKRVAKMYAELMTSLRSESNPSEILKTRFHEKYDEMIVVPNIEFASMCEHHFLPFTGRAFVAYIPGDCVVGLSKIPRVVEYFARMPQIQERMTRQIAELIQKELKPRGVAVLLEASHMCMTMRGVKKPGATMVTTQLLGRFKTDEKTRAEFMTYIHREGC